MEEFKGLIQFMDKFDSDKTCRDYLRKLLYPENPSCPKCGYHRMHYCETESLKSRVFACHKCTHTRSLMKDTMFYRTNIPLRKWFIAIYVFTVHDNGITVKKMSELLDIGNCSAWHLLQRIRKSLHTQNLSKKLCGQVEADETYVGGKMKGKTGRGSQNKKIVFGTIERKGRVYAKVVENCSKRTLQPIINKKIRKRAKIYTDKWAGYRGLSNSNYKHFTIKHSSGNYVDGIIHTNTIESFWNNVKSTIRTHRSVSRKHLQKYVDAVVFFYNSRLASVSEKFNAILTKWFEVTTLRNLIDVPYVLD